MWQSSQCGTNFLGFNSKLVELNRRSYHWTTVPITMDALPYPLVHPRKEVNFVVFYFLPEDILCFSKKMKH